MGWYDGHLHEFEIIYPLIDFKVNIGIPNEEPIWELTWNKKVLPGWKVKMTDCFLMENQSAEYIYMISVIIGNIKSPLKRYYPEKKILVIQYVSKEKELALRKIVADHMDMKIF